MNKTMTCIVCPIGCELSVSYELKDGKFVKLGKDKNPQALEKKFIKL